VAERARNQMSQLFLQAPRSSEEVSPSSPVLSFDLTIITATEPSPSHYCSSPSTYWQQASESSSVTAAIFSVTTFICHYKERRPVRCSREHSSGATIVRIWKPHICAVARDVHQKINSENILKFLSELPFPHSTENPTSV